MRGRSVGDSDDPNKPYPPLFNDFCKTYRSIEWEKLIKDFKVGKCVKYFQTIKHNEIEKNYCGGREKLACKEKDWNHCPRFIEERLKKDACYHSDRMRIKGIIEEWKNNPPEQMENYFLKEECHMGFKEIGFPINVHGYLVGVVMSGQIFLEPNDLISVEHFLGKSKNIDGLKAEWDNLPYNERKKLENARYILIGTELSNKSKGKARYLLDDDNKVKQKIKLLSSNIKRFEEIAESRYRDFRTNLESTFKKELLGFIDKHKMEPKFFEDEKYITHLLKRMQDFWAFKSALLIGCYSNNEKFALIASNIAGRTERAYGISGVDLSDRIDIDIVELITKINTELHPCSFLGQKNNIDEMNCKILPAEIIKRLVDIAPMDDDDHIFIVSIPVFKENYLFLFIGRDKDAVCCLPHYNRNGVSTFCQDAILETCSIIVHDFYNLKVFNEAHINDLRKENSEYLEKIKKKIENAKVHLEVNGIESDQQELTAWLEEFEGKIDEMTQLNDLISQK